MSKQHRQHRAAAERLGRYLTKTCGTSSIQRPEINRISSSSTGGLHGAFSNWIAAAERWLEGMTA